jgi:periplasmic divalent cation tolerance protein
VLIKQRRIQSQVSGALQSIYHQIQNGVLFMDKQFIIVLVTVPNQKSGELIANTLLEKKLVACVNVVTPVVSFFFWQGEVDQEDEVLLLILKSRADLFESKLIPAVESIHPYEVPEIIALPIMMGSANYLNWIDEVTLGE